MAKLRLRHRTALTFGLSLLAACNSGGGESTGGSTSGSTDGESTVAPTGGESTITPTGGESTITPTGGESTTGSDSDSSGAQTSGTGETEDGPASVVLPLEVLGPAGTSVTATLVLQGVAEIARISVECHACGFDDVALDSDPEKTKASLRINGGEPIALKRYTGGDLPVGNPDILLPPLAEAYGGIGGGFRTIRFSLPISGLVEGSNTLAFEHTHASTESLGFRITDIAFLDGEGAEIALPAGTLAQDDPAAWTAPRPDEIAAGLELWEKNGVLNDPGFDALNGDVVDGKIQASCADCHARDGRDLKYFNYSNLSIIERARFHGLSVAEGEQIASYIRELPIPVVQAARPWNPPYQPGPDLDTRPQYEWAAGAGIDAVLAADADMRPYLFPAGETKAAVDDVVDHLSTLNLRELPVALQLPDWNRWLPRVHPRDAFSVEPPFDQLILADEKGVLADPPPPPFFDVVYADALAAAPAQKKAAITAVRSRLAVWMGRGADCYTQTDDNGPDFRAANAFVLAAVTLAPKFPLIVGPDECGMFRHDEDRMKPIEVAKRGLASWISVKQWELVHSDALEDAAAGLAPITVGGVQVPVAERGWFLDGASVFFRAPHFLGFDSRRFTDQDKLIGTYESTAWYHLQLVVNPGYRQHPLQNKKVSDPPMPSHFPYTVGFIEALVNQSGVVEPFRFWATYIKIRQQQTNGHHGVENGLDLRTAQPFYLYSDQQGNTEARDIGQPLWGDLAGSMIEDLVQDALLADLPDDWVNADQNSVVQQKTDPELDFTPYDFVVPKNNVDKKPFDEPGPHQGTNTFRVVPQLRDVAKVDQASLVLLIDWAKTMWPGQNDKGLAAWESLK